MVCGSGHGMLPPARGMLTALCCMPPRVRGAAASGVLRLVLIAAALAHEGLSLGVERLARGAAPQRGRASAVLCGAVVPQHVLQS